MAGEDLLLDDPSFTETYQIFFSKCNEIVSHINVHFWLNAIQLI